ncbi:MAG: LPS assembly lipoprotein LptE [Gallionellaceae bacterium]|nr:LPS assembly lipoprotein LptE [Gallionellaceae bacterium]
MRRVTLKLLAVAGLAVLAGCGFQLRGQSSLPFNSAYVDAASGSVLASQLSKHLDQKAKLASRRDKADVVIRLTGENRGKKILSLSGGGKVREYRLIDMVTVSAVSPEGQEMLAPTDISLTRDFSYSDEQILAKEAEEAMLRKDMDDDALRQILRRLAFIRKP